MIAPKMKRRSLRDELAFLLDSTVDLPADAYDRDTLLIQLESAFLGRTDGLEQQLNRLLAASVAVVEHEAMAHQVHKHCISGCVLCDLSKVIRSAFAPPAPVPPPDQNAGRCTSIGPKPERFRCGLHTGHTGEHTALIPTDAPWIADEKPARI